LLDVDTAGWHAELAAIDDYLHSFAPRLPDRLREEQQRVARALDAADAQPRREAVAH
jgi:phosphoenolpyruvate carboxykinase (GTP)